MESGNKCSMQKEIEKMVESNISFHLYHTDA